MDIGLSVRRPAYNRAMRTDPRDMPPLRPAPAQPDAAAFRAAMAQFPTGVTVVTALDAQGRPAGLTVSSFNSVSLDPPLVLWSLSSRSSSLAAFRDGSHWVVNILAADQVALARRFAGPREERFADVAWQPGRGGAPVLEGCVAVFECRNRNRHVEGDHLILVGEVEACHHVLRPPLVYHRSTFLVD